MDFLKSLALPQPTEHFHLLLFMLNLVFIIFLPYFGFLFGSSILSLVANRRGRSSGDPVQTRFAKDLIDLAMFSKSGVAFLAIVPALSMVFLLAQLLQSTPAIASGLMGFGFLTLLAGAISLYWYRYTFRVSGMLSSIVPSGNQGDSRLSLDEIETFARSNNEGEPEISSLGDRLPLRGFHTHRGFHQHRVESITLERHRVRRGASDLARLHGALCAVPCGGVGGDGDRRHVLLLFVGRRHCESGRALWADGARLGRTPRHHFAPPPTGLHCGDGGTVASGGSLGRRVRPRGTFASLVLRDGAFCLRL